MKTHSLYRRLSAPLVLLSVTLSISCSATSNTKRAINERPSEQQWLTGIDNCSDTVEQYFDWHAKALSIGPSLELEEYNWLHQFGFRHSGPFYEMYDEAIAPQQNIKKIESISVACIPPEELVDSTGKIDVTYISNTGERKTHYFVDQLHEAFNIEHNNNPFAISAADEPVPEEYIRQLANKIAGYENEIQRAKGLLNDFAVLTDNEVELLVNWPNNILATTTIEKTSRSDRTAEVGEPTRTEFEHLYTRSEDRMMVRTISRKYNSINAPKEDNTQVIEKETVDKCVRDERFICTFVLYRQVPLPYYIESPHYFRNSTIDAEYVKKANAWMDGYYEDTEHSRKFKNLTNKELSRIIQEEEPVRDPIDGDTFFAELLNGLRLKKGEYTPIDWRIFTTWTQKTFKYAGKHTLKHGVTYLGRTPCQAEDTKNQCAKIKFEREVLNPGEGTPDRIHYVLSLDFVIEPHTLLVHSYNANERRTMKRARSENSAEQFVENIMSSSTTYQEQD